MRGKYLCYLNLLLLIRLIKENNENETKTRLINALNHRRMGTVVSLSWLTVWVATRLAKWPAGLLYRRSAKGCGASSPLLMSSQPLNSTCMNWEILRLN